MNLDSETDITIDVELDASGLNCPLPILKAKKAMNSLQDGQVLCVISTDPGSRREFEMFARQTQNELLDIREEQGKTWFIMKKSVQQMTA